MTYQAIHCRCSYEACPDWHVSDVAQVHGVHFTKAQAEATANFLNLLAKNPEWTKMAARGLAGLVFK